MQITMIETRRGTEDGFTVRLFERGKVYEVQPVLARSFLAAGCAVPGDGGALRRLEASARGFTIHWRRRQKKRPEVAYKHPRRRSYTPINPS